MPNLLFINFNESNINLTNASDINLMELYSKGKKFKGEKVPYKKTGKIVKTTRNHQLIDNLNMKRKG